MNIKPRKAPTLQTVADLAGVSKETVSHILGKHRERYSEQTRVRVLAAVKELGYRPHRGAQMLNAGRSHLIAIVHFGQSYVVSQTAKYLPLELRERGFEAIAIDLSWEGGSYRHVLDRLLALRVDGVIVMQMSVAFNRDALQGLIEVGVPVVSLAGSEKLGVPIISANSSLAIETLTRHLIGLGHRRLLQLGHNELGRPMLARRHGFISGIAEAGSAESPVFADLDAAAAHLRSLPADKVSGTIIAMAEIDWSNPGHPGYIIARALATADALPDAIICSNDQWARCVINALMEAGVSVPQTVAVTGFDNEPFGAYPPYCLTTVAQPRQASSKKIVEVLCDLIGGKAPEQQLYELPCELVIRRSCGSPQ